MVLWLPEKPTQQAAWGHMLVIPAFKAQELLHVPGQPGLHGDSLSQNNQKKIKSTTNNSAMDRVKEEDPSPNN